MPIWAQGPILNGPRFGLRDIHLDPPTYGHRYRRVAVDHCMLPEKDGFARGVCSDHVRRDRPSGIVASRGIASFKGSHPLNRVSGTPPLGRGLNRTPSSNRLFGCSRMGVLVITWWGFCKLFCLSSSKGHTVSAHRWTRSQNRCLGQQSYGGSNRLAWTEKSARREGRRNSARPDVLGLLDAIKRHAGSCNCQLVLRQPPTECIGRALEWDGGVGICIGARRLCCRSSQKGRIHAREAERKVPIGGQFHTPTNLNDHLHLVHN